MYPKAMFFYRKCLLKKGYGITWYYDAMRDLVRMYLTREGIKINDKNMKNAQNILRLQ